MAQEGGTSIGLGESQHKDWHKGRDSGLPYNLATKDNVNGGSKSASGSRVIQSDNPGSSMAPRGFSVPGFDIPIGLIGGFLMKIKNTGVSCG